MSKYLDVKIETCSLHGMDRVDRILAQWHRERPDLDVGPMGLLGRLKRIEDRLELDLARVFAKHGLTTAGFDVLATLRRSGAPYRLTPSDLIAWTMVSSGTMTNRLDRLEAAGLVERNRNPTDGRGFVVALTPKGLALIDTVVTEHVANQHVLVGGLAPDEFERLDDLLKRWLRQLEGGDP